MKRYSEVMHEFAKARQQPVKAPQQVLDELKRIREQLAGPSSKFACTTCGDIGCRKHP